MKLSLFGRLTMALLASMALGLGMTACGGGTIGYIWVLGQQYNQIAGFKVDDYTGNLTTVPTSPFATGGSVPVSIVVKPGGRYVYVINQGTGGSNLKPGTGQSVVELAVGGDGTLTYQDTFQTQGYISQWAQMDSTGQYLYVLDQYGPTSNGSQTGTPSTNGIVTVFLTDPTTGRLTLVTNSQTKTAQGLNTYYFNVGPNPIMMKTAGACLFTLNGNQTYTPYSSGNGGQLVTVQTSGSNGAGSPLSTTSATSINGNGSNIYVTDSNNGSTAANYIFAFGIGTSCSLNPSASGPAKYTNFTGTANPTYSLIDNSGKYLYVLNSSNTNTTQQTPYSSISAFTINSATQQLQQINGAPYTVGSGPVCMVEDTSNKYIYVSNHNDGTITGKVIDPTTGNLSDLTRGASFNATGQATCLVLSGAVS
jgi:6-phosphogluconolactonase (cycloisomerase 2 family)